MSLHSANDVYSWNDHYELLIEGLKNFLEDVYHQPEPNGKIASGMMLPTPDSARDSTLMFQIDWTIVGSILLVMFAAILWWISREKPKNPAH